MTDEFISRSFITGDSTDVAGGATVGSRSTRKRVARYAREYNMNHKNRGLALIFNHEFFKIPTLQTRLGTNVDAEELSKTFKKLGFDVTVHKDCKWQKIRENVEKAAAQDHTDNDCLAIAILSHGEHGCIYANDIQYKLDLILHYFTAKMCPTLAGKPKLFFIQACQGYLVDGGMMLNKCQTETDGDSSMSYKIPVHADFLISYSTIPGYTSWRNINNGSWYIQALIEELNSNGKTDDLLTMLTFVSQRVAIDFESNMPDNPINDRQKQIPCFTSMLTRMLHFGYK
ncbi:caspase-1-like isoform X1 [Drosophila miranda]|uniref:caspase-1-like isoform X1 n=1 Tax=Drosophila miranda TaxID=7229 RepID=UPI00143FAD50|nr:caspase-1-like isoform X1 [Drosophila miranda]